jgi:hypothetical protein
VHFGSYETMSVRDQPNDLCLSSHWRFDILGRPWRGYDSPPNWLCERFGGPSSGSI